ncbi:MAG: ECF-type sigma factor [Planctomycetota bacterium]
MDQGLPAPGLINYNDSEEIIRLLKRLVPFALTKIDKLLVSKLDPEDIVQSVFRNFFTALQKGNFKPASWEEMWYLLAKMTIWKCNSKRDFYLSQARDVRIERPFDDKDDLSTDSLFLDEKLILEESLELVMIKLEDENRKKVFCLILQGQSPAEIAEEFGVSKKTIERFKNDIKEILTLEINQGFLKK